MNCTLEIGVEKFRDFVHDISACMTPANLAHLKKQRKSVGGPTSAFVTSVQAILTNLTEYLSEFHWIALKRESA